MRTTTSRFLWLFCLVLASSAGARADTVYRCEQDGRIVFTNQPCNGGLVVGGSQAGTEAPPAGPAAPQRPAAPSIEQGRTAMASMVDRLSGKCARGDDDACTAVRVIRRDEQERLRLAAACTAGERRACDEMTCSDRGDVLACARVAGRETGTGWMEIGRTKRPVAPTSLPTGGPAVLPTETAITIECVASGAHHEVFVRPDLGIVAIRDGATVVGPDGRSERPYGTTFPSLRQAGDRLCSQTSPKI